MYPWERNPKKFFFTFFILFPIQYIMKGIIAEPMDKGWLGRQKNRIRKQGVKVVQYSDSYSAEGGALEFRLSWTVGRGSPGMVARQRLSSSLDQQACLPPFLFDHVLIFVLYSKRFQKYHQITIYIFYYLVLSIWNYGQSKKKNI